MPKVTTIPATRSLHAAEGTSAQRMRRVAGYARVSTGNEDQANSYAAQVDYYTKMIQDHQGWELAGIYTDEGISGTSTTKRTGFQAMINAALAGDIDLIITKSVSRFARNTVDSLTAVRQLKDAGVEVYFEKESIWTFDSKGELLITIMSSLAQEESRSISENVTWGHRKRFQDGKPLIPFSNMLGFSRNPDGSIGIEDEGANVVRRIYRDFLTGASIPQIARKLTAEGIPTPRGKHNWSTSTVRSILTNEKYKGDALLQKGFTTDFLTKKRKVNEGEVPQYYVTGSHQAIIDPDTWALVQQRIAEARAQGKRDHVFTGMITCTHCGGNYGPKLWHSTDKYSRTVWQCNNKYKEPHPKRMPTLTAEQLRDCFQEALAQMILKRRLVDYDLLHAVLADTADLEERLAKAAAELEVVTALMEQSITTNATHVQDQDAYRQQFAALEARHGRSRERYESIRKEIARRQDVGTRLRAFQKTMSGIDQAGKFDPATFHALTDHLEVDADGTVRIVFHCDVDRSASRT